MAAHIAEFKKIIDFGTDSFFLFSTASIDSDLSLLSIFQALGTIQLFSLQTDLLQMQQFKCVQKRIYRVVLFRCQTIFHFYNVILQLWLKIIQCELW